MSKIPFDIKWKPQIESGEYKVETRNGLPVRIICWDRKTKDMEILALVYDEHIDEDNEDLAEVALNGRMFPRGKDHDYDLFIVTPEEEMSEFEKAFDRIAFEYCHSEIEDEVESIKKSAAELLAIAREQLIKDGYVIAKKAFYDAVENISDKHFAEMSVEYSSHCKVENGVRHAIMNWDEFQKVVQKFIDIGKVEALKDIVSLIQSRLNEIVGDAQPKPILRAELQELIKTIKEE